MVAMGLPKGLFQNPQVLIVAALVGLCLGLLMDLEPAFLRSIAHCRDPSPDDQGRCPVAYSFVEGRCKIDPNVGWSGSKYCPNPKLVMNLGVRLGAKLQMGTSVGHVAALLLIGPLIDAWGRKPVILMALLGDLVRVLLFVIATFVPEHALHVMLPAVMIAGCANAFPPAVHAMVADLSDATDDARSAAFSALKVLLHGMGLLTMVLGFFVLRMKLEDYTMVWTADAALTGIATVVAACMLRETLPQNSSSMSRTHLVEKHEEESCSSEDAAVSGSAHSACRNPFKVIADAICLVSTDCFLCQFLLIKFLTFASGTMMRDTVRPFLIAMLDYSQEFASLAGAQASIFFVIGNFSARPLVHRFGAYSMYGVALGVQSVGFAMMGLGGAYPDFAHRFFWTGSTIAAVGTGVYETTSSTIMSLRVGPESMGTVFTLEHLLGIGGHMIGIYLSSSVLFDARATGWRRGICFDVASFFILLALLWYFAAYNLLVRTAVCTNSPCENSEESDSSDFSE